MGLAAAGIQKCWHHRSYVWCISEDEMQTAGFDLYWAESARRILDSSAYWIGISSVGDFLGTPPSYTLIKDPMLRLCHRLISCSIVGRSQAPEKEGDAGGIAEEDLVAPESSDEDKEMPQAVPPPPRTQGERITRLEDEVHGMREVLQGQTEVLDSMARDLSRFTT
nr:hypothetical protein [Tanacetum cinerariifolium]